MKCPKCGYLGFEHVERCRNCGYNFLLTPAAADPELSIRSAEPSEPDDFALPDLSMAAAASELPLFGDDAPLITRASPPRAPLAVRRSTPEVPRLRSQTRPSTLEFAFEQRPVDPQASRAADDAARAGLDPAPGPLAAGMGSRCGAALLDLAILAAVDVAVLYFTLRICGITTDDLALVPKVPLAAFLIVQNLGYLVAFNAGGQTLGKMAMGIRVVPADDLDGFDVGHALLRTAVWIVLAVPAGLGFLSALVGRDHRGLHDRFAGTRVVRA
jgi:uncharacterized RDD family membrane protein YckC